MAWPRDDAKLDRVRALMAEHELDALVVRAPDNVLYLTNFWGMKGYDACVFPREGEPVLITIEASEEDAAHTAWTSDVRFVKGYAPDDPRPVPARTLDAALEATRAHGRRVGLELSLGTQASDRMVGEPTTFTQAWFDAWPGASDAMPVLNAARAIKSDQELQRMRLANEICAAAMEHVRARAAAGDEGERSRGDLAGVRPRRGDGLEAARRPRAAVLARVVGAGHPHVHRDRRPARCRPTSRRSSRSGSAPTATGATTRSCSARASCATTTASSSRA